MFELYQAKEKTCPSHVVIDGANVKVNADFRNVLKILALLKDKKIPQYVQIQKLIELFYIDLQDIEPETAVEIFIDFVNAHKKNLRQSAVNQDYIEAEEPEKWFDYYFDSEEIYASFLSEYSINLIHVEFLHWYEFNMLLKNLSNESAFRKKTELRFMDLSVYSRDNRAYMAMSRAKQAVQLPIEYSEAEIREIEAFDDVWGRV